MAPWVWAAESSRESEIMETVPEGGQCLRFGSFEVDTRGREIRKRGLRLRLQEKPFRILELLLENPGEVISREELHRQLWPDVFVGFDRNLNTAINTLRHTLGDSARSPRFIETCQRRGYRFIAPVESLGDGSRNSVLANENVDSVAVLPFRNEAKDPELEYLSDGITESVINALSQLPRVRVMARSTVFRFKGPEVDPRRVGRELSVRTVLAGRVLQHHDTLDVGIELVDVRSGWLIWGATYHRKPSDILLIQREIARDTSEKLSLRLTGEERDRLARYQTADVEAYRDYLKGRYHINRMTADGLKRAMAHFQSAIRRDQKFALPYAGLADCYGLACLFSLSPPVETAPKAKEAAMGALALDETLAEAHAALAGILKSYEWNWAAAEREYRRALDLNPNYAEGHHQYADFLSAMGRPQDALREIHRAQELDPLSLVINMEVGWNYYMAREYGAATEHSLKTLEMEPAFEPARHTLGLTYVQLGRFDDAIVELRKALDGSHGNPASLAALGHALAVSGNRGAAEDILNRMKGLSKRGYVSCYLSALVYAGMAEHDAALEVLARAMDERDAWLVWLKMEPRFDGLRTSPRFHDLLRRLVYPS